MLTLFHHPICPKSRFVRLVLEEYGLQPRLVEERVWERREEFLVLNPAGTTPVLVEEGAPPVPGAGIIAEYLDETRGSGFGAASCEGNTEILAASASSTTLKSRAHTLAMIIQRDEKHCKERLKRIHAQRFMMDE